MGLWNNLVEKVKEAIDRSRRLKLGAGQENPREINYIEGTQFQLHFQLPEDNHAWVTNVNFDSPVTHGDGRVTNLMLARILNSRGSDAALIGTDDYVAFELPQGAEVEQEIINKLVGYYLYEKNNPNNNQEVFYIGEINGNPNDNQVKKSENVEQYVNKMSARIRNFREAHRENPEKREARVKKEIENGVFETNLRVDRDNQKEQEQKNRRRENPYIEQNGYKNYILQDGKEYNDYNGVNVNTGDFLKIRKLNKVGVDETGRYLYTGYIAMSFNENDAEILRKDRTPQGSPVCFAIDKKVEDIVSQNNPFEVRKLLELFSQERNFRDNNGYMNYIGTLDRNGNITSINSPVIDDNISRICNEAYQRKVIEQREQKGQDWTY